MPNNIRKYKVVIDLGYGDGAKGKVTSYLANKTDGPLLNVRYSGGHQAAHRVVTKKGFDHVFSGVGSGSAFGADTYLTKDFILNPLRLIEEVVELKSNRGTIFIHPDASIVTIFDIFDNQNCDITLKNGTCGHGINAVRQREKLGYTLTYGDFEYGKVFDFKYAAIKKYYENLYGKDLSSIEYDIKYHLKNFNSYHIFKVNECPIYDYFNVIFESSQGILLDKDIGFFPNVTHANVSLKNLKPFLADSNATAELFLVTRAYQTRHGNGPLSYEDYTDPEFKIELPIGEKNVSNKFQGNFRTAPLDLNMLQYAYSSVLKESERFSKINLVVTCLDGIKDKFVLLKNDIVYKYNTAGEFCNKIADVLKPDEVYCSFSPYAEDMNTLKEIK